MDHILSAFNKYYETKGFSDNKSLKKVLLKSLDLNCISSYKLKMLFFPGLVGNINVENVIPYIYSMDLKDMGRKWNTLKKMLSIISYLFLEISYNRHINFLQMISNLHTIFLTIFLHIVYVFLKHSKNFLITFLQIFCNVLITLLKIVCKLLITFF